MAYFLRSRLTLAATFLVGVGIAIPSSAQTITSYAYDSQGQVRTVTRPTQTVIYTYDAAANRTAMASTAPSAGRAAAQPASVVTNPTLGERVKPSFPPAPYAPSPPPFPPSPPLLAVITGVITAHPPPPTPE